jgi:hypothetical protein
LLHPKSVIGDHIQSGGVLINVTIAGSRKEKEKKRKEYPLGVTMRVAACCIQKV